MLTGLATAFSGRREEAFQAGRNGVSSGRWEEAFQAGRNGVSSGRWERCVCVIQLLIVSVF